MKVTCSSALVVEYLDAQEGFRGWFVRDTLKYRLCAGGMRIQPGLSRDHLCAMAGNMTLKMQIAELPIDGAKCGIDYDPLAPGKLEAIVRFMNAIRPYIKDCYSMGPDLNVDMRELEAAGARLSLPSVKMAIAAAQGWDIDYFLKRYAVLRQEVNGWTIGGLRAGAGVAQAVIATLDFLGIPLHKATAVIQGFGMLAKATAYVLQQNGIRIMGMSDAEKSIVATDDAGLDLAILLAEKSTMLPEIQGCGMRRAAKETITGVACDVFIPAAVEGTVTEKEAAMVDTRAVVPGANLAVTVAGAGILAERGILVLPDFLAGCGGSLSMEGLFGALVHPNPEEVLAHVSGKMAALVKKVLTRSRQENISPTEAAKHFCLESDLGVDIKPYSLR